MVSRFLLPPAGLSAKLYWAIAASLFVAGFVVLLIVGFHRGTDIYLHALYLSDYIKQRFVPAAFLYYLVLGSATLFTTNVKAIVFGSAAILAAALVARFQISANAASRWPGMRELLRPGSYRLVLLSCLGLVLLFCIPLPGEYWYVGHFPPNVWHNSTNIFLMPFALLLYLYSCEFLESGRGRLIGTLVLLSALNVLIKPNFFFCFAPVFPLFALTRFGLRRQFLLACLPVLAGCVVMLLQYLHIYHGSEYDRVTAAGGASITFGWFYPWREWANNIPLSIVNSVSLPLVFCVLYPRVFFSDSRIRYALTLLVVGVGIYAFVYETGARELHGNFGWQTSICNYLLHFAVIVAFLRIKFAEGRLRPHDYVLLGLYGLQVIFGVAYVVRLAATGVYL